MISHSANRKGEPVDTEIKQCHHLNFLLLIRTVGIGIYFVEVLKLQIVCEMLKYSYTGKLLSTFKSKDM